MMPVSRDTFNRNLEITHIPQSDYTIIEKLSTENEAIQQASREHYNVCIIYGDQLGLDLLQNPNWRETGI
jgi:hypothetical protein